MTAEDDLTVPQTTFGSPEALMRDADLAQLHETWSRPRGLWGWLVTTNHKDIAERYIVTAFIFFILAGILAVIMRIQLAVPENHFPALPGGKQEQEHDDCGKNQTGRNHGGTAMFVS